MTTNKIKEVRERVGLSQVEAAARAGIQPSQYNRIERYGFNVSNATAARIAAGLGVSLRTVFPDASAKYRPLGLTRGIMAALLAAMLAVSAQAQELHRQSLSLVGRTNVTSAVGASINTRGFAYRLRVTVGGVDHTNTLVFMDGDGSTILSNAFVSGATVTNFSPAVLFLGLSALSLDASSTTITNDCEVTFTR